MPEHVLAFSFNLFEPALDAHAKFGIELIGAGKYDPDDADWATEEVWVPERRQLLIPTSLSGDDWEDCLARMSELLVATLRRKSTMSKTLRGRSAVAIGFVDGDLYTLWPPPSEA